MALYYKEIQINCKYKEYLSCKKGPYTYNCRIEQWSKMHFNSCKDLFKSENCLTHAYIYIMEVTLFSRFKCCGAQSSNCQAYFIKK